ncbi:MAG: haloacid dehalogenase [Rhodospirillaceae bacterium]|nr:haloacid dehalogenase [Rhodospirillaceae bacterium]
MTRSTSWQDYLVVFDCDGTLIDSGHNIVTAMCEAWRRYDLEPPPANDIRRIVGLKLDEAICKLMPPDCDIDSDKLVDAYIEAFSRFRDQPDYVEPLYPGIAECLNDLSKAGFQLGVATGKSRRGLARTLGQHGIEKHFSVLKTADDGPGKPNPDILLDAIAETGAAAETTAMIGDTIYDMIMAKDASAAAIGVDWGYHEAEELKDAGARTILNNCSELYPALQNLWRTP